MARVTVAHSSEIILAGLQLILGERGHEVFADARELPDVVETCRTLRVDVLVLGYDLAEAHQPQFRQLCSAAATPRIILLLRRSDASKIREFNEIGADGLLLVDASADKLGECLHAVITGSKWLDPQLLAHLAFSPRSSPVSAELTLRENEIFAHAARGLRNKEIARALRLSEGTVKMHLHHIYGKLHLAGRMGLLLSQEAPV